MAKSVRKRYILALVLVGAIAYMMFSGPRPGHVYDEAMQAGVVPAALNPIAHVDLARDYFHDMDRGVTLQTKSEMNGRNMWLLWTGGNDRFWDFAASASMGNTDLLKILSSYDPDRDQAIDEAKRVELRKVYKKYRRGNRFDWFGTINEPCFSEPTGPDPKRYGLWLDMRDPNCTPDPFENEADYPGIRIGARGGNVPVGSYYGYASGIVGLRLFPNPAFDAAAAAKWDAVRYYTDPEYYRDKDLVRPYRVGMACGFCHVGLSPTNPPADPENPKWENVNATVGSQYLWLDRVFSWEYRADNLTTQIFKTWRPGTAEVSLISQDYIDNPRTINAVYNMSARLELAKRFGKEQLGPSNAANKQLNDFVEPNDPRTAFFVPPSTIYTMRVLKDGSDSVGVVSGLGRVYLNIGLFSEEWLLHFTPMTGGTRATPIELANVRKNSVYWQATESQTVDLAAYLVKAGRPDRLRDVAPSNLPAGFSLDTPAETMEIGKRAFADRCLRCHSSKLPPIPAAVDPGACSDNYLECWNRYFKWTQTDDYRTGARELVAQTDFLDNNYLSTDLRVPVTLLQTNLCASLATNSIRGNVWDNFSSETFKNLPSVGAATYYDPFTGEKKTFDMPAGGRGYIRPASLVSLWSTAPYLLNNSVGPFDPNPSVDARLRTFDASITEMLWPERRQRDPVLGSKIPGTIDRTTAPSYLRTSAGYLPGAIRPFIGLFAALMPSVFNADSERGVFIGPFPAGLPVSLLANAQLAVDQGTLLDQLRLDGEIAGTLRKLIAAMAATRGKSDEEARRIVATPEVLDPLMKLNKCPDFVVNRGHYFGTESMPDEPPLSNDERMALIAFLKTF